MHVQILFGTKSCKLSQLTNILNFLRIPVKESHANIHIPRPYEASQTWGQDTSSACFHKAKRDPLFFFQNVGGGGRVAFMCGQITVNTSSVPC